ncbi:MAG: HIT family protein [Bacteroidales bacterium]|jgi:histidine triad (HIT) family protein|nr:HIT family protein [Bacteroidales bacterium]MBP5703823.1 HIT family protein [Paludibacteraceae bacterium]
MATIFTRIIKGEIPCYKIYEDENYFAFLDINPLQKGHTLVIPKKEDDYIFNLDDNTYAGLMMTAKKIAAAIKESTNCKRVGVTVLGMEVPHVHIHLVPMNSEKDMLFSNPKKELSKEEFEAIAADIAKRVK